LTLLLLQLQPLHLPLPPLIQTALLMTQLQLLL
jgi:hypothetical protein